MLIQAKLCCKKFWFTLDGLHELSDSCRNDVRGDVWRRGWYMDSLNNTYPDINEG